MDCKQSRRRLHARPGEFEDAKRPESQPATPRFLREGEDIVKREKGTKHLRAGGAHVRV